MAASMGQGKCLSSTGVYNVPTPAGPIATVLPNMGQTSVAVPPVPTLTIDCMPALCLLSVIILSMLDQAGLGLGLLSGLDAGPCEYAKGSPTVSFGGAPAVSLGHMTNHNGKNAPGAMLAPSQTTVILGSL